MHTCHSVYIYIQMCMKFKTFTGDIYASYRVPGASWEKEFKRIPPKYGHIRVGFLDSFQLLPHLQSQLQFFLSFPHY